MFDSSFTTFIKLPSFNIFTRVSSDLLTLAIHFGLEEEEH